jgi:uncharacterized protein YjbI with pentapeptide repeats
MNIGNHIIFKTLRLWIRDILLNLKKKEGWRLVTKIFIVIFTLFSASITVMSFHNERNNKEYLNAESKYEKFRNDIYSDSREKRLIAIKDFPKIILLKAPSKRDVGYIDAFLYSIGFKSKYEYLFKKEAGKLYYMYFKRMNVANKNWSLDEMRELIEVISGMGEKEWFGGRYSDDNDGDNFIRVVSDKKKRNLNWIWKSNKSDINILLNELFVGVKADSLDFSDMSLKNGILKSSSFNSAGFQRVNMNKCDISESCFNNVDFSFAKISEVYGDKGEYVEANFYNTDIERDSFIKCNYYASHYGNSILKNNYYYGSNFNKAVIYSCKINSCDYDDTDLNYTEWTGCDIMNSSFRSVEISDSNILGCTFKNVVFRDSKFKNTKLRNSDFENCDFECCDMRGADFTRVKNIKNSNRWVDANIAGVVGLNYEDIGAMISGGAVIIENNEKWEQYKKDGRPNRKWKLYAKQ